MVWREFIWITPVARSYRNLRVGPVHYNTIQELDKLLEVLT